MYKIELIDTVKGVTHDITARVKTVDISEVLDAETTSFKVNAINISLPHLFHHINIYENEQLVVSGVVINQTDTDGFIKHTTFDCDNWGSLFSKRVVAETYLKEDQFGGNPELIIKDILGTYAPEFDTTPMKTTGVRLSSMMFKYETISTCFKQVFNFLDGYHYYVDQNKGFHFFNKYESDGGTYTDQDFLTGTLGVNYLGNDYVNRLWIVGKEQTSPDFISVYFNGDGSQRFFVLPYEPNYTQIFLDGVLMKTMLVGSDDGLQDFLVDKEKKVVYIPDNIGTPFSGQIKVSFRPTKVFIDYYENYKDIQSYGLKEGVDKSNRLTTKEDARMFGMSKVREKSTISRVVNFTTMRKPQLGQRVTLNIVEGLWNVQGQFVVRKVDTMIQTHDVVHYKVEVGEL